MCLMFWRQDWSVSDKNERRMERKNNYNKKKQQNKTNHENLKLIFWVEKSLLIATYFLSEKSKILFS